LDTIEDDMTLSDATKQPLLRSFHEKTVTPGWTFNGSGPDEKDRQLLVEYEVVTHEINLLDPASREVIVDICKKMQTGMADYAHAAATSGSIYLEKIEDYDLYCHYVAGVVGEGVSRLFTVTGKESPLVAEQLELSNSMGLFLQKTNIIRDFREDADERRFFWPREIWGRSDLGGPAFKEMAEMHQKGRETQALWVLSAMVVDALRHAEDCLDYLKLIKNQTVFNFCAIPQVMAIATQELVFMNPLVFQRNVKIRKALAADVSPFPLPPNPMQHILTLSIPADHAGDKPTRCLLHLPRLCQENPQEGFSSRPFIPPAEHRMWKGNLLSSISLGAIAQI
jgi:farnesyl-diphosphate farnesyltransferase